MKLIKDKLFRAARFYKRHGLRNFMVHLIQKTLGVESDYNKWFLRHAPDKSALSAQAETKLSFKAKFSVIAMPGSDFQQRLKGTFLSLTEQTYANWELLSIGHEDQKLSDSGVVFVEYDKNSQIAEILNRAAEKCSGDYILFMQPGDQLAPNALFEIASEIEKGGYSAVYTDEDKIEASGIRHIDPIFKPDFNLDLLRSTNYISNSMVISRRVLRDIGGFKKEYGEGCILDLYFRIFESSAAIGHITKVLYHSKQTSAKNEIAQIDHMKVLRDHYSRMGIDATVSGSNLDGILRTRFSTDGNPLVSVLIPNKDHIDDLDKCLNSLLNRSSYKNMEIIIIENNSTDKSTFEYYDRMSRTHKNISVMEYKGDFNYSAINNYGAGFSKGEYILLLNNDTEIINADCIEEMLGHCMRDEVGIVGAKLYYGDGSVQHAGVIIGLGGIAGHAFVSLKKGDSGYLHRENCTQNYSAVTAACMMTKKSIYESVGGLTEEMQVAFNDIDYCMKVRKTGKLVVYTPYAELFHYESKSRGQDDTPEKARRFNSEVERFAKRWPDILKDGDPYYNPNLTLVRPDFSIKD
jgi:GT2 family glycosyltransferase